MTSNRHQSVSMTHPFPLRLTPNELAWIEFIRLASYDIDPRPTLRRVQQLRRIFEQDRPDDDG